MTPQAVRLPDGRVWLRVTDPSWPDPLDSSWSRQHGGRWNPPGAHATLYLNADIATCRLQLNRLLEDSPATPEDLDDSAFDLVGVSLPVSQVCAEAVTAPGLRALGLPASYPLDGQGRRIGHAPCQAIGVQVKAQRLRGVWCRSAASLDARGRELAWFPATQRSRARSIWAAPKPLGAWRAAQGRKDLGLETGLQGS